MIPFLVIENLFSLFPTKYRLSREKDREKRKTTPFLVI